MKLVRIPHVSSRPNPNQFQIRKRMQTAVHTNLSPRVIRSLCAHVVCQGSNPEWFGHCWDLLEGMSILLGRRPAQPGQPQNKPQGETPDERESYRRGYVEGWTRALEAMDDCLRKLPPLPFVDDRYHDCFDHIQALESWARSNLNGEVDPPPIKPDTR